jgi:sec-independent protein translocase protein TatA
VYKGKDATLPVWAGSQPFDVQRGIRSMGIFSTTHLLIFGVIALLLFGNRLPSVMRSLGSGISEFKKGLDDVGKEVHGEVTVEVPKEPGQTSP